MENKSCQCEGKSAKIIFACSGAADVGQVTDLVARRLHAGKFGQMKCLAFVGAGIPQMIDSVKGSKILVIDGCNMDCGRITMTRNGLADFTHLRLTDLGYCKGATPPLEPTIDSIFKMATNLL